jgi:hypothetical protein
VAAYRLDGWSKTAPVSHQKQPHQNATNAIEIKQKRIKINEPDRYSAAHNGLVAGSSPAGRTSLRSLRELRLGKPAQVFRKRSGRRLPRRSPSGEGGPRSPPNQNIENNPMQSNRLAAGRDASPSKTV